MTEPAHRNRLDEAASPYLQQHVENPVDWQPWDEIARDAARERDVPIFLSIGYSACHWCHVMADESFQDATVADALNEHFVPIKVDREELPDVDRVYQTICQLVTGQGGWPLSVWLTPDGRPFFVGTYFPKTSGRGRPGFLDLLERLADSWEDDRAAIEERADEWAAAIATQVEPTVDVPDRGIEIESDLPDVGTILVRTADREHGGFGSSGPKFPQPQRIEALLWLGARGGAGPFLTVACESLDAMADRGMYDHVGGGFHRYATDRAWRIPHFEKMLYDNATLPPVYLAAYQLTERDRFAEVVRETFAFVERELRHPDGGFYSSLDAQSDGREGAFYVWTPQEIDAVLDPETADLWRSRYGVTERGNFEGNTSVLARQQSLSVIADEHDRTERDVHDRLTNAREELLAARASRPRPHRDEKILAGWNGLMISALAHGGIVLDSAYTELASDAIEFLRAEMWKPAEGRLYRRFRDGRVGIPAYLDDYAFLGRGAFDVYQATGDVEWLEFSISLLDAMLSECWDDEVGVLYLTPTSGDIPVSRPTDAIDQSLPSSVGVAADLCCALAPFVPHRELEERARRTLSLHEGDRRGAPAQHVTLSLVADRLAHGSIEWTIASDGLSSEWREAIAARFIPARILTRRPPNDLSPWLDRLGLDDAPPIWASRDARGGETTAYICRDFTCSPPLTDPADALEWVDRFGEAGRVELLDEDDRANEEELT